MGNTFAKDHTKPPAARKAVILAQHGNQNAKGLKHTPETKKRISLSLLGWK